MYKTNISQGLCKELRDICIAEEPRILRDVEPFHEDDENWMTGRLWNYNFLDLDYDAVRQLKDWIRDQYVDYMHARGEQPEKVYIQCWLNVLRNDGRRITPHHHATGHSRNPNTSQEYCYLSGNLCVQTPGTHTWFQSPFLDKVIRPIPNVDGELIMFPSWIIHQTDHNITEAPRLTISFDIVTEEFFNKIDGTNYRLLFEPK